MSQINVFARNFLLIENENSAQIVFNNIST